MSMLMITHDLGVIGEVTDEVAVMYVGKVVERTSTKKLFSEPLHPYTKALFKSRPRINSSERLSSIDGTVPSPYSQTKGCSFAPRCEVAMDICKNKTPKNISKSKAFLAVIFDPIDSTLNSCYVFSFIIRNFYPKLLFKSHYKLNSI